MFSLRYFAVTIIPVFSDTQCFPILLRDLIFVSPEMDVIKGQQRQRQVASLRARRLNQTAEALLLQQLHVLEKLQAVSTRRLARGQHAVLLEAMSADPPQHYPKGDNVVSHRLQLPPLNNSAEPSDPVRGLYNSLVCPQNKNAVDDRRDEGSEGRMGSSCRYVALSQLPCHHFPCVRPATYNTFTGYQRSVVARVNASVSNNYSSSEPGQREMSTKEDDLEGHTSPRTSVRERLRGLRQLVHEMRARNEGKRPHDRCVNYGQPLSRRLLRKPVVPISLEA